MPTKSQRLFRFIGGILFVSLLGCGASWGIFSAIHWALFAGNAPGVAWMLLAMGVYVVVRDIVREATRVMRWALCEVEDEAAMQACTDHFDQMRELTSAYWRAYDAKVGALREAEAQAWNQHDERNQPQRGES